MEWSSTGYLALSALNVKNGYIDYSKDKYYGSDELYNKWMNGNNLYKGQVIFTTEAPMGNIVQIPDDNKYILSQRVIAFCVRNDVITDSFLALLLKSPFVFSQLISLSSGGTAQGISQKSLSSVTVYLPSNLIEQQKIADCLSSLDELIEAHEQKLDALKQHKKGLMQRLFPAEGETTPRWRFPEFKNAGEWENISVSQLGKIITGKTPITSNLSFWNGEYIWVTPTDITSHKDIYSSDRTVTSLWIKNNILPVNTVLITCIASIGKNCILRKEGFCNQQINAIVPNLKNYDSSFIYYNFEKNEHILINNSGASATRILPKSKFEKLHFLFPFLPEQQKIADCLTSLDERIEAQEEKITALKEHKKGLMQQLFPSL